MSRRRYDTGWLEAVEAEQRKRERAAALEAIEENGFAWFSPSARALPIKVTSIEQWDEISRRKRRVRGKAN